LVPDRTTGACPILETERALVSLSDSVRKAGEIVRAEGRISLRLLGRELGLDAADLADVVDELVVVQRRAVREGDIVVSSTSTTTDGPRWP